MTLLACPSSLAPCASERFRSRCSVRELHSSSGGRSSGIRLRSSFVGSSVAVTVRITQRRLCSSSRRFVVRARELEPLKLGSAPPFFQLEEPSSGKLWSLDDFEDYPALLVMFMSYRCPFVVFLRSAIVELLEEYMKKGLGVVAISPNSAITFPQVSQAFLSSRLATMLLQDGPAEMQEEVTRYGYKFPYLYDEAQDVTQAYAPLGTPDFFVYRKNEGKEFELAYHGQFDDARPHTSRVPITGKDLRAALECVLSGKPVDPQQQPSMGCAIKWHPHILKKLYPGPKLDKVDTNRPWLT